MNDTFDDLELEKVFLPFWKAFPHCDTHQRSKRAISKAVFKAIVGPGRSIKHEGLDLFHQTTAETLVQAAKAYHMTFIKEATPANGKCLDFVPGAQAWLNQGRFEDFEAGERESLAKEYDDFKQAQVKRGLEVVR